MLKSSCAILGCCTLLTLFLPTLGILADHGQGNQQATKPFESQELWDTSMLPFAPQSPTPEEDYNTLNRILPNPLRVKDPMFALHVASKEYNSHTSNDYQYENNDHPNMQRGNHLSTFRDKVFNIKSNHNETKKVYNYSMLSSNKNDYPNHTIHVKDNKPTSQYHNSTEMKKNAVESENKEAYKKNISHDNNGHNKIPEPIKMYINNMMNNITRNITHVLKKYFNNSRHDNAQVDIIAYGSESNIEKRRDTSYKRLSRTDSKLNDASGDSYDSNPNINKKYSRQAIFTRIERQRNQKAEKQRNFKKHDTNNRPYYKKRKQRNKHRDFYRNGRHQNNFIANNRNKRRRPKLREHYRNNRHQNNHQKFLRKNKEITTISQNMYDSLYDHVKDYYDMVKKATTTDARECPHFPPGQCQKNGYLYDQGVAETSTPDDLYKIFYGDDK